MALSRGARPRPKIRLFTAGGTANHVHVLISVPPALCLPTSFAGVESAQFEWIREHGNRFAWQQGYGALSVSAAQRQIVIDYISDQEEHHRIWTFEQEFLTLLKEAELEFDTRFVFG